MAGRKEYEMLFALNAQMNGGFSNTFSKAQSEFSRLGKEIQDLHRLQGDISSYQKQQTAVESTRSRLESLQKQHDLLQKEISETNGSTTAQERESVKLEQRIKDTETALERQTQKLQATSARLQEAGVDTANLAQKDQELTAKIKELEAEQDQAASGASTFGERTTAAFGAIQGAIAAAGIATALKEIYDGYVACVDIAADFQETMSTVEALSGANAEEMAALSAEAKELGATTKFTAKESAEAMTYMGMAGWDAQEMLSGMDGVLQLAAASGEDLAMVSDIVTDSLTAFGLTAADTAHFADVLAMTATKSNTNVATMGDTFKYAAPLAGALGYSVEDVATMIGLMANSGIKGSMAGTALRNMFSKLVDGAELSSAAFGDVTVKTQNADGTMRSLSDVITDLRARFAVMTDAEKMANAETLVGERAMTGFIALMNSADGDFESLYNNITNCSGAASRMASIKLDNLNGQLTLMNSAWDALKTTIGEEFNPELQGLAEIATDVLTAGNEFLQDHPALVKAAMTFVGVVGLATAGITAYVAITKVAAALNLASVFAVAGPVMLAVGAVAGLTAGIVALVAAANEGVPSVKELTEAAQDMNAAMDEAGSTFQQTSDQTLATAQVADSYISKLEELGEGTDASNEHSQTYLNTLGLLCNAIPELTEYVNLETGAIEGGTAALREQVDAWKENAEAQAYQEYMNSVYGQYNAVMEEAASNSMKLTEAQIKIERAEKNRAAAVERMNELQLESAESGEYLSNEYYELQNSLYDYDREISQAEKTIKNLNKAIEEDAEAQAAADAELAIAKEAYERVTGATEEMTEAEAEAARQSEELDGRINSTMEQVQALTEAYNEAYGAAYESISGQYALWDQAAEVAATSAADINSALESQITYWQDYNANLQSLSERAGDIEGLSDVIASFADGSADSVNAIAGLANASDEDLAAMVANWQELQKEQEAASGSIADLQTDFTQTMDELQTALAEDIEAMDLGTEAAASGRATIQGYIDGANDMLPNVRTAYSNLGRAAKNALAAGNSGLGTVPRAYASGTTNAAQGVALVGEDGPELVFFNGGEKVLSAAQTAAVGARAESALLAPAARSKPPVSVTFQISGDATPETVRDLRTFADEIVARVMDSIEDAEVDEARGAFR
ncbi:phage tail tape measure protein [uncultured Dysosmobacter sp.]|uniref:phage tail tape measure protein n=1 Tax=uncultured Dysosmobacter sp. TaxID=2591384 RepID=UPI0026143354|nr:phage tail tape measure protein [uncultured Dysosmobacter sp.]